MHLISRDTIHPLWCKGPLFTQPIKNSAALSDNYIRWGGWRFGCNILIMLVLILLMLPVVATAQTEVEGEVSGVWDEEGNPYYVVGETFVAAGDTLIIRAGVEVHHSTEEDFWINGSLITTGEEGDSVTFLLDVPGWRGFRCQEGSGEEISFNYTRSLDFDTVVRGDYVKFTITNSRCNQMIISEVEQFACTNNEFSRGGIRIDGNPDQFVFQDNLLLDQTAYFRGIRNKIITNNRSPAHLSSRIQIGGGTDLLITDNEGIDIYLTWAGREIRDVTVSRNRGGSIRLSACNNCEVTDNLDISYIFIMDSDEISINNNKIHSSISCLNGDGILIEKNRIDGTNPYMEMLTPTALIIDRSDDVSVVSNTIRSWHPIADFATVFIKHQSNVNINNNIIVGNGPLATGILIDQSDVNTSYNCIGNVGTAFEGIDSGEGDIEEDPLFTGGHPFEIDLRWDSPCIDAGDSELEEDPDGTRADIGANPFDQRVDPPPIIISRWLQRASRNWRFEYEANAIDNGEQIDIFFNNLPEWLNQEERDDVEGRRIVSGIVPEEQDDFTFSVRTVDADEQEDTLTVMVNILDETILSGDLSINLTRDNSPYIAFSDLVVQDGDTLQIDPGVEIIFPHAPVDTLYFCDDILLGLIINGNLVVEGSADSHVILRGNFHNSDLDSWTGISINEGNSPILLNYMEIRNAETGLNVISRPLVDVSFCKFEFCDNFCIHLDSCFDVRIESCTIRYAEVGVDIRNSSNVCYNSNTTERCWENGIGINSQFAEITGNTIFENGLENDFNGVGIAISADSLALIRNNQMFRNMNGLYLSGLSVSQIQRNVISNNAHNGILISGEVRCYFSNNIISDNSLWGFYSIHGQFNVEINYNLINNGVGSFSGIDNMPEGLGSIDTVNINGDSCDVYGNIYIPPRFIGFGPVLYRVRGNSPAINAGNPEDLLDPDSTIADIGVFPFDHNNRSPNFYFPLEEIIDLETRVGNYIIFDLEIGDPENDTLFLRWIKSTGVEESIEFPPYAAISDSIFYWETCHDTIIVEITDANDLSYRQFNVHVISGYEFTDELIHIPYIFEVQPPFPNPFNNVTNINLTLSECSDVNIFTYDILGRFIKLVKRDSYPAGRHKIAWITNNLPSGNYIIMVEAAGTSKLFNVSLIR